MIYDFQALCPLLGKLDLILCAFWIKLFPINHGHGMPRYFYDLLKYAVYFGVGKHSKKLQEKNDFTTTLITNQTSSGRLLSVLVNSNANDFFNQILSSFDSRRSWSRGRRPLAKECFSYFTFHVFYDQQLVYERGTSLRFS